MSYDLSGTGISYGTSPKFGTNSLSAGNRWIRIDLTSSLNVSGSGFTVSFSSGQLQFQIDN